MIPILLVLAAQSADIPQPGPSRAEGDRFARCAALVRSNADRAVDLATEWQMKGGGVLSRQCLGLAYSALSRWPSAATTFEQAARDADSRRDPRAASLWAQSGNAWLAANEAGRAMTAFDAALASATLVPELRGEVHIDRARAQIAKGDLAGARVDIDKGLQLASGDGFGWYISALLARREGNLARARVDISKALQLAPNDADLLLEAGNIAGLAGDVATARGFYSRAATAAPDSDAGRAAQAALAANAEPPPAQPAAPQPAQPQSAPAQPQSR